MLLGREEVAPGTEDKNGRTPFSWAAGRGHIRVVEMLLEQEEVTPDTPDKLGQRPLLWAVFSAVRGPRRARRGDCQEPGIGRDGKT